MKLLSVLLLALAVHSAPAQENYPTKPVRLIIPFPPGGGSDVIGRVVGQKLGERLGQSIVVDNRTGAGGSIGADSVARSAPDGYTLLLGSTSEIVQYPNVNRSVPYDPQRDFAPITLVGRVPLVLVAHPSLPANSVQELIALAHAKPGEINFSSAGNGSTTHLAVELLALSTRVKMTHVPYKGSVPAVADLVAGRVQVGIPTMPAALTFIRDGRLKALAVSTAQRSSALPQVPTIKEAGVADYDAALWTGLLAPAKTPPAILSRLHREVTAVLNSAEVREALARQGAEPSPTSPEEFKSYISEELARWAKVVKAANLTPAR